MDFKCYPMLKRSFTQAPSDVATQLRPLPILAPNDIEYLQNSHNGNDEKAERIVEVILKKLKEDPKLLNDVFTAIRAAGSWIHKTVQEVEKTYRSCLKSSTKSDTSQTQDCNASASGPLLVSTAITPPSTSSTFQDLCSRYQLSDVRLNQEVSDDHILEVYSEITEWRLVAAHLHLTRADIRAIEGEAKSDEKLMRLYMLQEWKKKTKAHGTDWPTYQVLIKALLKCECSYTIEQLCALLSTVQK